jgi:hypothetical protein
MEHEKEKRKKTAAYPRMSRPRVERGYFALWFTGNLLVRVDVHPAPRDLVVWIL